MDADAVDLPALILAIAVALAITVALFFGARESKRRAWITAGAVTAGLIVVGLLNLLRATPRETHLATVFVGAIVPVLSALGLVRATQPMRPVFRWPLVFFVTLVVLFAALLFGATMVPRYL